MSRGEEESSNLSIAGYLAFVVGLVIFFSLFANAVLQLTNALSTTNSTLSQVAINASSTLNTSATKSPFWEVVNDTAPIFTPLINVASNPWVIVALIALGVVFWVLEERIREVNQP